MSIRGFFALSKSASFLGRPSIFNTTLHINNNNNTSVDINKKRKMSMDMGGHGSMDNISSFTDDKMGVEEVEKGSTISIDEDIKVVEFLLNYVHLRGTLVKTMYIQGGGREEEHQ